MSNLMFAGPRRTGDGVAPSQSMRVSIPARLGLTPFGAVVIGVLALGVALVMPNAPTRFWGGRY